MARKRAGGVSEDRSGYRGPSAATAQPTSLPDGTVRYVVRLAPKGRVLLPADVRAAMGLAEGDLILAWLKDGQLRLESQSRAITRIQDDLRRRVGDKSLVDELIGERRAAAVRGE